MRQLPYQPKVRKKIAMSPIPIFGNETSRISRTNNFVSIFFFFFALISYGFFFFFFFPHGIQTDNQKIMIKTTHKNESIKNEISGYQTKIFTKYK